MGLFSKNKKPKSKARKIIEWILTGLFAVIFVFFGVMTIVGQVTKKDNFNVPRYGDYQVLEVLKRIILRIFFLCTDWIILILKE